MLEVTIEFQKFGGEPYTEFQAMKLGDDRHGVWLLWVATAAGLLWSRISGLSRS